MVRHPLPKVPEPSVIAITVGVLVVARVGGATDDHERRP